MWFSFCVPLGVAGGARRLMVPHCQLVLKGDLRAGKEMVAWLPHRGQCSLCDMAALWPPFCSFLAPEWLPRCLLELGNSATFFLPVLCPSGVATLQEGLLVAFCFTSPPPAVCSSETF